MSSGKGLRLAGLKSEVASGAGKGGQEGTGLPTGMVGPGQLWMGLKER